MVHFRGSDLSPFKPELMEKSVFDSMSNVVCIFVSTVIVCVLLF